MHVDLKRAALFAGLLAVAGCAQTGAPYGGDAGLIERPGDLAAPDPDGPLEEDPLEEGPLDEAM
jgi:hypothetical protein